MEKYIAQERDREEAIRFMKDPCGILDHPKSEFDKPKVVYKYKSKHEDVKFTDNVSKSEVLSQSNSSKFNVSQEKEEEDEDEEKTMSDD